MPALLHPLLLLLLCAALGAADSGRPAAPAGSATAPAQVQRVGYVQIDGDIAPERAAYFKRAIAEAQERHLDAVVVHMTTNGGRVDSALEMVRTALDVPKDGPRLIAFADHRSYSAGALIAYAHNEVWLTTQATIGDIGVIFIDPTTGKMEYAPEKAETVLRAQLRLVAQNRGWNQAKLVKMTAREQDLYRFDLPASSNGAAHSEFVIEDDLAVWLREHPYVDTTAKVLVLGEDRLITYTAAEAVAEGMATGMVADLDALYARLGTSRAQVVDLRPSVVEETAWLLAGWAPMLASLAVLLVILEFKFGTGGLLFIGAAVCGLAFLVCQYYLQLADYREVLLILGAVLIVAVDVFFLSSGWLALAGLALGCLGLVMAFMPDGGEFQFSAPGWSDQLGHALLSSLSTLVLVTVGLMVLIAALPHLRAGRRLAVAAEVSGTAAGRLEAESATLVGRTGTAASDLRPAGAVDIDGRHLSANAEHGAHIHAGTVVTVVEVRFGELVVRAAEPGA